MSPPAEGPGSDRRPGRRLLWFALFYALSLTVFTGLVYALRAVVRG